MNFRSFLRSGVGGVLTGGIGYVAGGMMGRPGSPGSSSPDASTMQFDENGYPIGLNGPPSADRAGQYQYFSEQAVAKQREADFGSARGALQQGTNLLQSFRPGGSAALASGMFQGQANLNYAIGAQRTAPDLLFNYREDKMQQAAKAAKDAQRMQLVGAVLGAAGTVGGALLGGPPGAIAGGAAGRTLGGGGGGLTLPGGQQAPPGQGSSGGLVLPATNGGQGQSQGGGGGGPATQSGPVGGAAPAPGGGGNGGPGGPGVGAPGGPSGGGAGGGGAAAMQGGGGGFGADGNFTSTALAASRLAQNPDAQQVVAMAHAQDMDMSFWDATHHVLDRQLEHAIMELG